MDNLLEKALVRKIRFDFNGQLSLEQLYSLGEASIPGLTDYEAALAKQLKEYGEYRRTTAKSKVQEDTELKLAVVTRVIDSLMEKQERRKAASASAPLIEQALAEKEARKMKQFAAMSDAELDAFLAGKQS
jgi:hypothetical protein